MTDYKTNLIKVIHDELANNANYCVKALDVIHSYQVHDEYDHGYVRYANNMGFTPADAKFLTSLCEYKKTRELTEKQLNCLVRIMPKYARQLFDHFVSQHKIQKCSENSKYHMNLSNLWVDFVVPCPETAEVPEDFDSEVEAVRWQENLAEDANYYNVERFMSA